MSSSSTCPTEAEPFLLDFVQYPKFWLTMGALFFYCELEIILSTFFLITAFVSLVSVLTINLYFTFKYEKALWKNTNVYIKLIYSFPYITLDIKKYLHTISDLINVKWIAAHLPAFSGLNSLSPGSAVAVSQIVGVLEGVKCKEVFPPGSIEAKGVACGEPGLPRDGIMGK